MSAASESRKRHAWVPDFFIAGAMKCGTSTLHAMLARHPDVHIPQGELFFFDFDDFLEHPDFFAWSGGRWTDRDFDDGSGAYLTWYRRLFGGAAPGQLLGEDSTTYLASPRAPQRIARFNPDARIIVMLRDPASRSYSAYWHLLRYGRVFHNFEDSLRLQPDALVRRSLYKRQLDHWLSCFPRAQLHVVLLEELISDSRKVTDQICRFLGLSGGLPEAALGLHWNRGDAPRFPRLQMLRNRAMWRRDTRLFLPRLPQSPPDDAPQWLQAVARVVDRAHRRCNPLQRRTPPMRAESRTFLNRYFQRENRGLDAIVGEDLARWWYRA